MLAATPAMSPRDARRRLLVEGIILSVHRQMPGVKPARRGAAHRICLAHHHRAAPGMT